SISIHAETIVEGSSRSPSLRQLQFWLSLRSCARPSSPSRFGRLLSKAGKSKRSRIRAARKTPVTGRTVSNNSDSENYDIPQKVRTHRSGFTLQSRRVTSRAPRYLEKTSSKHRAGIVISHPAAFIAPL